MDPRRATVLYKVTASMQPLHGLPSRNGTRLRESILLPHRIRGMGKSAVGKAHAPKHPNFISKVVS